MDRRPRVGHNEPMKHITAAMGHVLFATDFTEVADRALDAAIRMARLFEAQLHILHVNEEEIHFGAHDSAELTNFLDTIVCRRQTWLAQLEERAQATGVDVVVATRSGVASEGIMAYAEEVDAGLVVLGMVGHSGIGWLMSGSTAKKVLRGCERPVLVLSSQALVAPPGDAGTFSHVLYPNDLSPASHAGLKVAELLVERSGARLSLAHVLKLPTLIPSLPGEPPIVVPRKEIDGLEARLQAELDAVVADLVTVDARTVLRVHAGAAEGIAELAKEDSVDLIALPRHSRHSMVGRFFGHTAERLAMIAPVPVLIFTPAT